MTRRTSSLAFCKPVLSIGLVLTPEQAKENGASMIVIIGNAQSPLTNYIDLIFLSIYLKFE